MWKQVAIAIVLAAACSSPGAQVASVRDLPDELKSVRKGRLSEADITLMGMRIGREKLQDVLSRLGLAALAPRAEHADSELCYRSESPLDSTWVVFGSGAMGGWEELTRFQVLSSAPANMPCRPTMLVTPSVATDSGIRKGMTVKELRSRFGAPTEAGRGYVAFSFQQKSDHPARPEFDMLSALRCTIRNGRVTSFEVTLIESN